VGLKPPRFCPEILRWCPPCSPEAVSEIKAQAEAKVAYILCDLALMTLM
jgi:hypothetical protein